MVTIGAGATLTWGRGIGFEDLHRVKIEALIAETVWVVQCAGLLASDVLLVATQLLGAGLCSKEIKHGVCGLRGRNVTNVSLIGVALLKLGSFLVVRLALGFERSGVGLGSERSGSAGSCLLLSGVHLTLALWRLALDTSLPLPRAIPLG